MKARYLYIFTSTMLLCSCGTLKSTYESNSENETINVGYGTIVKDKNTYGVSQMEINEKEIVGYSDIFEYIRGRVPGVIVGPSSAGTQPKVQIRGINSINSSTEPLYIVDGMELTDITYLNPMDVASISVLKDASSSIYGVRGANGVIIITTKSANERALAEAAARREMQAAARAAREAEQAAKKAERAARKVAKGE